MGTKAHSIIDMDAETVIRMLNKAYADEWLAFLQYWTASKVVRGMLRPMVEKELETHAEEEYRHASMLAERINQLGGTVLLALEDIVKEANCSYLRPGDPCSLRIIDQTLASERCAISVYQRMMDETHGRDPVTYHLAMRILEDELDHEHDFQQFREDIEHAMTDMKKEIEK